MEFLSKNLKETAKIAKDFKNSLDGAHRGEGATVVGLYGELGSGKTTFMKYLAEFFDIKETIQSPTYVIMRIYKLVAKKSEDTKFSKAAERVSLVENFVSSDFLKLTHIDAYRIEKEDEMLNLGWQKIISDPKNLIFIEWPEKISGIMPEHTKIFFEHADNKESRKISISNF